MQSRRFFCLLAAFAAFAASPAPVPTGCRLDQTSTSLLRIYECQEQLRVAAETATRLSAIERGGRLIGLRVEGGAVLVESSGRADGFRIETPEAAAEVRNARVAVESTPEGTSVFVRSGGVAVSQDDRSVNLRTGQGVDLAALSGPVTRSLGSGAPIPRRREQSTLTVKTWGKERAGRLLGRLGGT